MNMPRIGLPRRFVSLLTVLSVAAASALVTSACGQIKLGNSTYNDPAPQGTILAQGEFTSLNGKTVTGTAQIYDLSGGTYIVRLNGISAPAETGLQIVVVADGKTVMRVSLRGTSGTQNYSFTPTTGIPISWDSVTIYSAPANRDYGQVLLQK